MFSSMLTFFDSDYVIIKKTNHEIASIDEVFFFSFHACIFVV